MIDLANLDKFNLDDYVKDTFIGFYQELFRQNSSEFKWDPDKNVSRINIADQFSVDNEHPEIKPLIYLRRRPLSFMNTSIDQMLGSNLGQGASSYADLIAGSLEVVCVSSVELEACRLAGIIFMVTNAFRHELEAKSGMFRIDVKALGEAMPLNAGTQVKLVEVPVMLQVMFTPQWVVGYAENGAPKLKEVVMARSVSKQALAEGGLTLKTKCNSTSDGTVIDEDGNNSTAIDGVDNNDGTACVYFTQI